MSVNTLKFSQLSPALILFLLSPVIGELLSGSAPPLEFFHPFGFVLLTSLYGSGALLIRDLRIRWKKGIGSTLLLGAAYGIIEEGILVASFFNPNWPDLGQLSIYGRWLGTNWIWALMLTVYHAVYSITIPILLVEMMYPNQRMTPWLSERLFKIIALVFTGVVTLGFILINVLSGYLPPVLPFLGIIVIVMLLGYTVYKPPLQWDNGNTTLIKPWILWILGVIGTFVFFFGFWLMPTLIPSWPVGMLVSLGFLCLATALLKRYTWTVATDRHRFALVSGALLLFIVFAPLQEFDSTRTDNTTGMTLVGLVFLLGLFLMNRQLSTNKIRPRNTRSSISIGAITTQNPQRPNYCVHCGSKIQRIALYCSQCGTTIAYASANQVG
jgi:hypothetical protein